MATVAVSAATLVGLGAIWVNNDGLWALQWGHQLTHGELPNFEQRFVSTPHPLTNALAATFSLLRFELAYWVFAGLVLLAFGAMVVLTFEVGRVCLTTPAALVGAGAVGLSPEFLLSAGSASMDLLFLAVTLAALLLALRGRSPMVVLAVLAAAGLLRPDAWLLSVAYFAWLWRRQLPVSYPRVALLALLAPALWLAVDLVTTGNPLHSVTHTQAGAQDLERTTGLANVPLAAREGLAGLLSAPVMAGGGAGFVLAAILRPAARPLLAVGILGGATYITIGVAGLSLLDRYLALPAIVLALTFGYAALGWLAHPKAWPGWFG